MSTRNTQHGRFGAEQSITRAEALYLYTRAGSRLAGSSLTGALTVGSPADLGIYELDPTTCTNDELSSLKPSHMIISGRIDAAAQGAHHSPRIG